MSANSEVGRVFNMTSSGTGSGMGLFGFEIRNGHLIMIVADGDTPPEVEIKADGHLYMKI